VVVANIIVVVVVVLVAWLTNEAVQLYAAARYGLLLHVLLFTV